jgi:hypothetical protein
MERQRLYFSPPVIESRLENAHACVCISRFGLCQVSVHTVCVCVWGDSIKRVTQTKGILGSSIISRLLPELPQEETPSCLDLSISLTLK